MFTHTITIHFNAIEPFSVALTPWHWSLKATSLPLSAHHFHWNVLVPCPVEFTSETETSLDNGSRIYMLSKLSLLLPAQTNLILPVCGWSCRHCGNMRFIGTGTSEYHSESRKMSKAPNSYPLEQFFWRVIEKKNMSGRELASLLPDWLYFIRNSVHESTSGSCFHAAQHNTVGKPFIYYETIGHRIN